MSYAGVNPALFAGGAAGGWRVTGIAALAGEGLGEVPFVDIRAGHAPAPDAEWVLRGTNGHPRYSERAEIAALDARQEPLGRGSALQAALIPIRKSAAWWALAQDERRQILERDSRHIAQSLPYLPAIARRLYQCRELLEPFDFITWFEFAPGDAPRFDELAARLRATREWDYVEREVEIRLERASAAP